MWRFVLSVSLLPLVFLCSASVAISQDIRALAGADRSVAEATQLAQGSGGAGPQLPPVLLPPVLLPKTLPILPNILPILPDASRPVSPPIVNSGEAYAFDERLARVNVRGSNFLASQIGFIDFGGVTFQAVVESDNFIRAERVALQLNSPEIQRAFGRPLADGDLIAVFVLNSARAPISAPITVRLQALRGEVRDRDSDGDGRVAVEFGGDDCDDRDPSRFAGNIEIADFDGHHEDCDPMTFAPSAQYTFSTPGDRDGDSFIDNRIFNLDASGRRYGGRDCDDRNPQVHPFQNEVRNGIDDDCDEDTDEGLLN